jgi:hypothetical protein
MPKSAPKRPTDANPDEFFADLISKREAVKKIKKPKKQKLPAQPVEPRPQNLPPWAPHGEDLNRIPPEVQQAVADLVQPMYEQFVLNAPGGLEKSLGVTITHLLWLEILDQFDIKRDYLQFESVLNVTYNRPETIDRLLRLIDAKLRISYFLVRLKELRSRLPAETLPAHPLPNHAGGSGPASADRPLYELLIPQALPAEPQTNAFPLPVETGAAEPKTPLSLLGEGQGVRAANVQMP